MQRATFAAAETVRPQALPELDPTPLLELRGITLGFGGVLALREVDLSVGQGEIRSVIGPNGAGKSSLLNVISGLYAPQAGTIRIGGVEGRVRARDLARLGIARTFQNLALFGGLSIRDNVAAGLTHGRRATALENVLGLPRARAEERRIAAEVGEVLRFLGLEEHAERLAASLPYGLQKRVELARALVARPRLLLLDEPMAGMTVREKAEMAGFVRASALRFGFSVILIEHDIGVVMDLSDRIAVLDYGRKIADGTPDEVRTDKAVIAAYLGQE